ncbi:MAG: exopolysaccharide biosynthesis protein [Pseudomonadota bacterium]
MEDHVAMTSAETSAQTEPETVRGATALLGDILSELKHRPNPGPTDTATLGDVLDRLDERAFGFLLLLLALPCCLPFVYLLPQIVSLPMLALAGQLAAGKHHPWFPEKLKAREFEISAFHKVLTRSERYVGWIEKLARPRLQFVTGPTGVRVVGFLMLLPTASIMVPLPSTNTVPGIGVAVTSLGLIERDGLLVILGLVIGFIWVGLLIFLGQEAASIIKDFITTRL